MPSWKELWKLVHEGGAIASRPGLLKFPEMRSPHTTDMNKEDRNNQTSSPMIEQSIEWGTSTAGPEYIAAPIPSGVKKIAPFSSKRINELTVRKSAGVYPTPHGFRTTQEGDHTFFVRPRLENESSKSAAWDLEVQERPWTSNETKKRGHKGTNAPKLRPSTADGAPKRGRGKKIFLRG